MLIEIIHAPDPVKPWHASLAGALRRPARDCAKFYGSALTLCRVDELTEEIFRQSPQIRLGPPAGTGLFGAHTLNAAGGIEVIDCVGPAPRFGKADQSSSATGEATIIG